MNLPRASLLNREPAHTEIDPGLMERSLEDYVAEDPYPIPETGLREMSHGDRHFDYWLSGLRDYLVMKAAVGGIESPVLELGSSSCRVLRHLLCHEKDLELHAADINHASIGWLASNIPQIHGVVNQTAPPLPYPDGHFSLVCAFSVFTHIADHELSWLSETHRILKPGGKAYFSALTDHTWERIDRSWTVYNDFMKGRPMYHGRQFQADTFDQPMPFDKVVFQYGPKTDGYGVTVFHKTDYIREVWGKEFQILDIRRASFGYQDVVVMKKAEVRV